jgi:AcrR family transcriptional regulator
MQVLDKQKQSKILTAAAELFAARPFHKVLLSDVAEAAGVGKGTLYIYFKNKEDIYISILYSGFSGLVDHLRGLLEEDNYGPAKNLEVVIRETVRFAYQNPYLFEIMRTVPGREAMNRTNWDNKRREFKGLIEAIIRNGIVEGIFSDPHPEWTARYIPGFVRSAFLDGIENVDRELLTDHILWFVKSAILVKEDKC